VPLAYLLAELPGPFLHMRWLLKHWGVGGALVQANEFALVAVWIFARNVPELWACMGHAWFETELPVAWRATVAVGNLLTAMWTMQACRHRPTTCISTI
jgi:hypothetical protein